MTLTKSWLQKQITDLETTRDEIPFGLDEDGNNTLAALKLALAGMEAEPVFKINHDSSLIKHVKKVVRETAAPKPLTTSERAELENYRNAQQVLLKDHQIRELVNELRDIAVEYHGTQQLRERIARTIRAAMLQGKADGNSPVITDGWVAVPVEPTAEMMAEAKRWTGLTSTAEIVYREMIAAAPQQEPE